jgi:hypothetical protein
MAYRTWMSTTNYVDLHFDLQRNQPGAAFPNPGFDELSAPTHPIQMAMPRQIVALLPLFLLGGLACAAAQVLASPAIAQLIFYVCLGLFFVALLDGVLQGEVEAPAGNPQASRLELRDDQFGTGA